MLDVVRPVKFYEHVVLARLQILIFFPNIAIHAHLSILIDEPLLLGFWVFDLGYN